MPARDKGIAVAAKLEMLIPASAGRYASREDERRGVEKGRMKKRGTDIYIYICIYERGERGCDGAL